MQDHYTYDYAVIRILPKVEREEFINAGVILLCAEKEFLDAVIELDIQKLQALDPHADIEKIQTHLQTIPLVCAGGEKAAPIGLLDQRERFRWLVAPRSTIIQTSPVHTGCSYDPAATLQHLFNKIVKG